jgi:hypothetical protein
LVLLVAGVRLSDATPSVGVVPTLTLQEIEEAIRGGWGVEICEDPADVADWSIDRPAWGQCGPTALVVNDFLGGELCVAEVHLADGTQRGFHWWNRLAAGIDLDLTREQFHRGELVQGTRVMARPTGPMKRGEAQYRLLRARVFASLGLPEPAA